ncbi:MAG: single-stranded DNA-binding protein [Bacteroidales bacterium]|nr:single-stranded DNA-binding protein [Bacteroidales bacterium]
MSVNKVILVGNVGRDPEIRATENGTKYARFSLATNETFLDKQGQRQTQTEWHRVVVWGKQADYIELYVKAGKLLYIEGRLRTSNYEKDGQKHYTVDVVCDRFKFLGPAPDQRQPQAQPSAAPAIESTAAEVMPEPNDLPF